MKRKLTHSPKTTPIIAGNSTKLMVMMIAVFSVIGVMLVLTNNIGDVDTEKIAGKYIGAGTGAMAEQLVTYELTLESTGVATLEYSHYLMTPQPPQSGTWEVVAGKSEIIVTIPQEKPTTLIYNATKHTLESKIVRGDISAVVWGAYDVTLTKLIDQEWRWRESKLIDGTVVLPSSVGAFKLTFGADGNLKVETDCNSGQASYTLSAMERELQITTPMVMTQKFCTDSQEALFLQQLSQVVSYSLLPNDLRLYFADLGHMDFAAK